MATHAAWISIQQNGFRVGEATRLNMMYEGADFDRWTTTMDRILREDGLDIYTFEKTKEMNPTDFKTDINALRAKLKILVQVAPSVYAKLPERGEKEFRELFQDIEKASKPFEIMNLPAELRLCILRTFLEDGSQEHWLTKHQDWFGQSHARTPPLPILQLNRSLRREALPLYFDITTFKADVPLEGFQGTYGVADILLPWINNGLRRNVKFLRHLEMNMVPMTYVSHGRNRWAWQPKTEGTRTFKLNIDDKGQLQVVFPEDSSQESKEEINRTLEDISDIYTAAWKGRTIKEALERCAEQFDGLV